MCDVTLQESGQVDAIVSGELIDTVRIEVDVGIVESG